jgi:hypothetical protein
VQLPKAQNVLEETYAPNLSKTLAEIFYGMTTTYFFDGTQNISYF